MTDNSKESMNMAARRSNGARNIDDFPLDPELTMPRRIAAFLDWWAKHHPYDFAQYNEITRAVLGIKRLPRMDTKEVQMVWNSVTRSEKILRDQHRRALIRQRGMGARASVDSADVIRNKQVDRTKRVERSIVALAREDEIVDVRSIPDTAANRELKQWYQRDVKTVLKQVASPEFLTKMLPPSSREEKKPAQEDES